MGPVVDPVESDAKPPERTDVVVIGGGIMGTSTAWTLAQRGVDVTLCEKGHIGGEQSSRNWGWVRKQGRDSREIPLIIESLRLWEGLNEAVEGETGFRRTGILYAIENDQDLAEREAWLGLAQPYQLDSRLLGSDELAELLPGTQRRFKGALYTASDGRAEPQKAAPAIATATRREGGKVLTNCAVRGIETSGGRVSSVVTEKGRIACSSVVLAGGAWSRLFSGSLGIRLPQLKVLSSVLRTEPIEDGPGPGALLPGLRLSPAPRRRLHHRRRPRQRSPDRAGQLLVLHGFPAGPALGMGLAEAQGRTGACSKSGARPGSGGSTSPRPSSACASSTPSRCGTTRAAP